MNNRWMMVNGLPRRHYFNKRTCLHHQPARNLQFLKPVQLGETCINEACETIMARIQ